MRTIQTTRIKQDNNNNLFKIIISLQKNGINKTNKREDKRIDKETIQRIRYNKEKICLEFLLILLFFFYNHK